MDENWLYASEPRGENPESILVVDDNPNNLRLLSGILSKSGYRVRPAISGALALQSLAALEPDLILLDIRMPGMDGFEVCKKIKENPQTETIPVIFISAQDENDDKVHAFEIGGVDFVAKPFQAEEVIARVRAHLALRRMRKDLERQNLQLQQEIVVRTKTEQQLARYRERLEDLVEQRTSELKDANDKITAILKSVPNGLIVTDTQGRTILMNRRAESLVGKSFTELSQQPAADLIESPEFREALSAGLAGDNQTIPQDLKIYDQGLGELREFQVGASPVLGSDGERTGAVVVLRDVTRERESDRMKSAFIMTAAHELSTPLAVVMGYAEFLVGAEYAATLEPEQRQDCLWQIYRKGEELSVIVDELLHLSQLETGSRLALETEPCEMETLVNEVVRRHEAKTDGHSLTVSLRGCLPPLVVDRDKILQVLECLVSNACKFSPKNTEIRIAGEQCGHECRISVTDHGVGMAPEQLARVFDKFYRIDTSNTAVGGMGLGLTIAKNIIEAHGGHIQIESVPNAGTTVSFSLPIASP